MNTGTGQPYLFGSMLEAYHFTCPYCWQPISVLLDLSVEEQTYIEDCEVCCRPLVVHYGVEDGLVVFFEASREAE